MLSLNNAPVTGLPKLVQSDAVPFADESPVLVETVHYVCEWPVATSP